MCPADAFRQVDRIETLRVSGPLPGLSDAAETACTGPVEADETYVGGCRANMSRTRRAQLTGRGPSHLTAVAGVRNRPTRQVYTRVVRSTDAETLQGFVTERTDPDATVYTDESRAYSGIDREHETVRHTAMAYVRGDVSTNGLESFWSMLKQAHKGTFHKLCPKHLDRYVQEFAGKHNIRDLGTLAQMRDTVARLVARSLLYRRLIADNGLCSGARS